jgi:hypothetical protein
VNGPTDSCGALLDGWATVGEYPRQVSQGAPGRVEHLFIVRMWREAGTGVTGWRGSAEHTATKERIYFASLVALTEFLDTCIAVSPPHERESPM